MVSSIEFFTLIVLLVPHHFFFQQGRLPDVGDCRSLLFQRRHLARNISRLPSTPESLVTVPPKKESCCPSRGAVSFGRAAQIYERSFLLVGKLHHNSNLGNIVTVDRSIISRSQGRRIEGCKRDFRVLDTPRIMQLLQILRSDIFKTPE